MSVSLYRTYRPKTFGEVIGQDHVKKTIQNELAQNRVAHAYLFAGPRGLGKTTVARLLAKAVNCQNRAAGESEPCNRCDACDEVTRGNSLDVLEIDAASHTGVDNVRENIVNTARFTPTNRRYKVFIIDEVHMLSTSAFNALLKTLEEPPAHAIFILATTEIYRLPQTIVSRCQRFDFRKVGRPELIERLSHLASQEKKKVDPAVLELVVRQAEGCVRDAETLLGTLLNLDDKRITLEQAELVIPRARFDAAIQLIGALQRRDATSGLRLINQLVQDGVDLGPFTDDTIEVLRKLLLMKVSPQLDGFGGSLDAALEAQAAELSQSIPLRDLVLMVTRFMAARQELKSTSISQLPLELATVEICDHQGGLTPPLANGGVDNQPGGTHTTNSAAPPSAQNPAGAVITVQPKETPAPAAPPQPTAKPAAKKPINKIKLTLEQIRERWEEVLTALKLHNHTLASTLRLHQPTAVTDEGKLEISFRYRFHEQRINDRKNREAIENILEHTFGTPLRVQTVLVEEPEGPPPAEQRDEAIDKLVDTFGGQVIK